MFYVSDTCLQDIQLFLEAFQRHHSTQCKDSSANRQLCLLILPGDGLQFQELLHSSGSVEPSKPGLFDATVRYVSLIVNRHVVNMNCPCKFRGQR